MGMNTSETGASSPNRALRGKVAPISIVLATKTASLVALLVIYYVLVFFAAIQVVPLTMGFVKSGSGVTMDTPLETVVAVWLAPSLFLIALVFVLVLVVIRALWRLRRRLIETVSAWAFGREAAKNPVDISPATAKKTTNRSTRKTKTA